jgi:hypothetical protein
MAAIFAAIRHKGRDANKDRNRIKRQASIHLKQILGDEFHLPDEVDSVAFLVAALDKEIKLGNEDKAQDPYDYHSLSLLINALREPSPAGIMQKLSTHAKRVATKMIVKVKQFKITKIEETKDDGEVNNKKKEQKIIIESRPLDRLLIISEKRLFIVMRKVKNNRAKAGLAENERCDREAADSGMEIIDSIPFHEIVSIEVWKKNGNQPKDITEDGYLLSKSDQEDKSDQNLRNGEHFLRILTQDDGFNCGNSFCISDLQQIHSGEFSKDTILALREYHTAAKKVFNNKIYLRKIQVWNSYRAGPAEILQSNFREIKCFG